MNEDTDINFDNLIVEQIKVKEKWQIAINEIQTREALGKPLPTDKVEKATYKARITAADEAIADLNKTRKEFKTATAEEAITSTISQEKEVLKELIVKNHIGFLPTENRYAYCIGMQKKNSDVINPIFNLVEANRFGRVLNKLAGRRLKLGNKHFAEDLADFFQELKKDYFTSTASFNDEKWDDEKVYNKAKIIREFWVQPDYENMNSYDPRFDFLTYCVAGGKPENMDHLEQWIAYKWMYPERVANTPNLDIGGYPGGNGKGREIELCKTIFTSQCIIAAALKELMDGFNGTWELATVLYYDEPAANELPEGKLKQATGGEDMRSERKGIDATMVDRNYSILFVSNNVNGVVKLAGTGEGGEDRRYSVMITDKVMVDEAINVGLAKDIEEAKMYVNGINTLIKHRKEVAKWLAYIIKKHKVEEMQVLRPLHGEDYKKRFEEQKSGIDAAFDLILPVYLANKCITSKLLHQLVVGITGMDKLKQTGASQKWCRYLARNKISYVNDKQRVKHLFNGEECFVSGSVSVITMTGGGDQSFEHNLITDETPTKTTKYTAENIILGQDPESIPVSNAAKEETNTVLARIQRKAEQHKDKP